MLTPSPIISRDSRATLMSGRPEHFTPVPKEQPLRRASNSHKMEKHPRPPFSSLPRFSDQLRLGMGD